MKFLLFILMITTLVSANEDYKTFETPVEGMLPYFKRQDTSPTWKKDGNDLIRIEDHQLESQMKKEFGSKDMKGKVSVVNFFFATCPGYCPRMTKNIKKAFVNHKDNKQVNFISYSVTPTIDTPKILNEYAVENGIADANWHLVRGDRNTIYDIARLQLLSDLSVDPTQPKDQYAHTESVYLVDGNLKVRGIYNSASANAITKLSEDITKLLNEK